MIDQIDLRVHDNPSHPHYGPARRLHVMLMQLTADRTYELFDRPYGVQFDETWDFSLASQLRCGKSVAAAQRRVLKDALWILEGED